MNIEGREEEEKLVHSTQKKEEMKSRDLEVKRLIEESFQKHKEVYKELAKH